MQYSHLGRHSVTVVGNRIRCQHCGYRTSYKRQESTRDHVTSYKRIDKKPCDELLACVPASEKQLLFIMYVNCVYLQCLKGPKKPPNCLIRGETSVVLIVTNGYQQCPCHVQICNVAVSYHGFIEIFSRCNLNILFAVNFSLIFNK